MNSGPLTANERGSRRRNNREWTPNGEELDNREWTRIYANNLAFTALLLRRHWVGNLLP
jgi:hypothetical protein